MLANAELSGEYAAAAAVREGDAVARSRRAGREGDARAEGEGGVVNGAGAGAGGDWAGVVVDDAEEEDEEEDCWRRSNRASAVVVVEGSKE